MHCTGGGGWIVEKGGDKFKVALTDDKFRAAVPGKGFDEERAGGRGLDNQAFDKNEIDNDQFGVEVFFCLGRFNVFGEIGTDEEQWAWEWFVIGTRDWNRSARQASSQQQGWQLTARTGR